MDITAKNLSQEDRDHLPAEHFAVPGKRKLPINDARHTKLAWDMVDRTQGLTPAEKAEARRRILHRAHELGIDTKDWHKVKSMAIAAMSLNIENSGHPNKMPFRGILTRLDQPSDAPPGGSGGRLIVVTKEAAERALPSLLGMAVNFTPAFDGHDVKEKIGLITSANIVGNAIEIEGFVYAEDFRETADLIQKMKEHLGFSFEAQELQVADPAADPLVITALTFTGAAILQKDKAAYHSTSIAASADKDILNMDTNELKALLAEAVAPIVERIEKIEAAAKTEEKTEEKVEDKLAAAIEKLVAAGKPAEKADDVEAKIAAAVEAAVKPLNDKLAAAETKVKDIEAKARENVTTERKTINPMVARLLAKTGIEVPGEDGKIDLRKLDDAMTAAGMSNGNRITLKRELERAGVL